MKQHILWAGFVIFAGILSCKPKKINPSSPLIPFSGESADGCTQLARSGDISLLSFPQVRGNGLKLAELKASEYRLGDTYPLMALNPAFPDGSDVILWRACPQEGAQGECFPSRDGWNRALFGEELVALPFSGHVKVLAKACTDHPISPEEACGPLSEVRLYLKAASREDPRSQAIQREFVLWQGLVNELEQRADQLLERSDQLLKAIRPYMSQISLQEFQNLYRSAENIRSMSFSRLMVFLRSSLLPGLRNLDSAADQGDLRLSATKGKSGGCPQIDTVFEPVGGGSWEPGSGVDQDTDGGGLSEILGRQLVEDSTDGADDPPSSPQVGAGQTLADQGDPVDQSREQEKTGKKKQQDNRNRARYLLAGLGGLSFLAGATSLWFTNQAYFEQKRSGNPFDGDSITKVLNQLTDSVSQLQEILEREREVGEAEPKTADQKKILKDRIQKQRGLLQESLGEVTGSEDVTSNRFYKTYQKEQVEKFTASNEAKGPDDINDKKVVSELTELDELSRSLKAIRGPEFRVAPAFGWAAASAVLVTLASFELAGTPSPRSFVRQQLMHYLNDASRLMAGAEDLLLRMDQSQEKIRQLSTGELSQ